MNEEESTFPQSEKQRPELSDDAGQEESLASFKSTIKDNSDLENEIQRLYEMKKVVEAGREKLRRELEQFESMKSDLKTGAGEASPGPGIEEEKEKIAKEWNRIDVEEKRLENDRRRMDILFDEISSRKTASEKEADAIEKERTDIRKKETELTEQEKALASIKQEYQEEKAKWEEKRSKQIEELKSLPDKKAELELEKANLRLEKMRFEEEKKPLEDEKRYIKAKRNMMDQEQEILKQQKTIIEKQKKRLLESGSISIEAKYELEKPIPEHREPAISSSVSSDKAKGSVFEVGTNNLRQTRYSEKEANFEKIRQERLRSLGQTEQPVLKAIRPSKSVGKAIRPSKTVGKAIRLSKSVGKAIRPSESVGKAIRVGKLPVDQIPDDFPSMSCVSCNTDIPIPPGSSSVTCPKCSKSYNIRGQGKARTPRIATLPKEPSSTGPTSGSSQPELQPELHPQLQPELQPGQKETSALPSIDFSSTSEDSKREEAKIYEKFGNYFIHCLNPSCKSEIELSNVSKKRVHCPECGRRNKISPMEG